MNSVLALAKTVAKHQKDWGIRLPFVITAYRASRHDATGYSPNFLVLGREARTPADIVYGSPNEEPDETYDSFVERMRERSVAAFAEIRSSLKRSAERNKRYYDLGVKAKPFHIGQWVLYFNQRKLRGKQMNWIRQYEGLLMVVKVRSAVTAVIQQSAKAKPKTVHIGKLKEFLGKPPKKWSMPDFVDEVYSPDDVVVRSDEERGDANSPGTSEEGRRQELNEGPIEDLLEVIRPLPLDKTNECSFDEGLENTGISLVNEKCSSPKAVVRSHPDEVTVETNGRSSDDVSESAEVSFVDKALPSVRAPFDGRVPSLAVICSPPDTVTNETNGKSLSERLLGEAKSPDDDASNGATETVDAGTYEADEEFRRMRPARQSKRPVRFEDYETQFVLNRRMRATARNEVEYSSKSSDLLTVNNESSMTKRRHRTRVVWNSEPKTKL